MVFLQSLYYVLSISSGCLFLMMMMMMNLVFAGPTGLTIKLIHRDSPESPLYPGNLTQLERMERAFQQSIDREQYLTTWMKSSLVSRNSTNSKSLDTIRPRVSLATVLYMVQIGIGTFANRDPPPAPARLSPIFYNFFIDTGSNLLWLQCESNNNNTKYFRQDADLFPGDSSFTYRPLPWDSTDPICEKYRKYGVVEGGFCGYRVEYADTANTEGILAKEKLTVNAVYGLEEIDNFVFGCGLRQNEPFLGNKDPGQNPISGLLGLGGGKESFIRQLGDRAQNKFEYCLKPWYDTNLFNTYLRFGSDTKIVARGGQRIQTTPIVPVRGETVYYVIMYGINVDGERVFYPDNSVFEAKSDGTGGCIFDSGCPVTQLSTQVYDPFKDHLIRHFFGRYNIKTVSPPYSTYELCFERPPGFDSFPIITFLYFNEAKFDIEPKAAFAIDEKIFCLTIRRTKLIPAYSVILGSLQQVNHRILHDLGARKISWADENCSLLG